MKIFKAVLVLEILIGLIWLLNSKLGEIPPLGKLLNPTTGIWHNAEQKKDAAQTVIDLDGLDHEVAIRYDNNHVPHIFAQNDHDLYFTQGYVTARDRLWQMDMQVRRAGGTLAEVLGPRMAGQDRFYRRFGLAQAAEKSLAQMMKDPVMKNVLESYTEGVNAYVRQLSRADYPIEYKLLNYSPAEWKPINSALIFKLMAETLSGTVDDVEMSNTLRQYGDAAMHDLFPDQPLLFDPVVPAGTSWDFEPLPLPKSSKYFLAGSTETKNEHERIEGVGSNNWAVSGSRSDNGFPILSNDPHLNLTLPAIWYQVQLASDNVNVYGVSIPGIPCVIIGYNQKVAWGLTNAEADVADWYQVRFKDAERNEYWYNNRWNKVGRRIEKIKVRGEKAIADTVLFTHHGPLIERAAYLKSTYQSQDGTGTPVGFTVRWVATETSEEVKTFYLLNRAKNYDDYRQALHYFSSPAQNFIFAGADNDISITSNGKFPLRYKNQGKFILDGGDVADDWHGWIPMEQNPSVKNPARGYVSSANQPLADSTYPYYISWQYGSSERATRINQRLEQMHGATVDSLRALQNDNYSILASQVLPTLLANLDRSALSDYKEALNTITQWNRYYDADSKGATIFNLWWSLFFKSIWTDDFDKKDQPLRWPTRDRTVKMLLQESNARWFDDTRTPQQENCKELINKSFVRTIDSLTAKLGNIGDGWKWGQSRRCRISHLAGIQAFSLDPFETGGSAATVNAMSDGFGPSWRMVVQLGPQVKGYGIFPGGQSGNPGSIYYDNLFGKWKEGQLNELVFLQSKDESNPSVQSTISLK
ncbi:MAG: penicillin acylase family protein [Chitinophagaceae bacterium]